MAASRSRHACSEAGVRRVQSVTSSTTLSGLGFVNRLACDGGKSLLSRMGTAGQGSVDRVGKLVEFVMVAGLVDTHGL
jgi:hypothetical protein